MEPIQTITIRKCVDGFRLDHKHTDFTSESYHSRTNRGVLNSVENLLNGFLPDIIDLYRRDEDEVPAIHVSGTRKPRPLD